MERNVLHFLIEGISNFTVKNYVGRWYEYSRLFLVPEAFGVYHLISNYTVTWLIEPIPGVCVRATYTDHGDGPVGVFNEQISSL